MFHPNWRQEALSRLDDIYDLLIVGGGITGCGVALDAAQRGLRVLLVERDDLAAGTSSRSSKMIHGGLRYLKELQFGVTREAARERDRLVALNPDMVRPIRFLFPVNRGDRIPGWTVDLGLWLYDRLTTRSQRHTHLEADEVQALAPGLAVEDLDRAMAYSDAVADDAALTLAVAATAFAYGALVLTRCEALEPITGADGRIQGLVARDLEGANTHRLRARLVVNATGVWVDRLRERCRLEGRRLRPSRGSHLVLPVERLPIQAALTLPAPDDGRPVFLVPHPEGVLVGTTDLYHEGSLDDPRATRGEVDYLLRTLQAHFPERRLGRSDVRGVFAGLRPILESYGDDPTEASRDEEIWEERGLLSVAGGKLTTWRSTAEAVVDEALGRLPPETAGAAGPCLTAGTPLVGLAPVDLAERLRRACGLPPEVAVGAARRLRSLAWWLPRKARSRKELAPILEGSDLSPAEVRAHLSFGAVLRLEDLLLRRARIGLWSPALARELAPRLRPLFAQELGWDRRRWQREEEAFHQALEAWAPEGVA